MPVYLAPFKEELRKFIEEEIPTEFKRRQIDVAVFMYRRIIAYTPIKTGVTMANWRVTTGEPDSGLTSRQYPLTEQEIRGSLGGMAAGSAATVGVSKANRGRYDNIWIYNNYRSVQALEDGHTINPAKGYMVKRAMADTLTYMSLIKHQRG